MISNSKEDNYEIAFRLCNKREHANQLIFIEHQWYLITCNSKDAIALFYRELRFFIFTRNLFIVLSSIMYKTYHYEKNYHYCVIVISNFKFL
ncbi:hypothetical protein SAMN05444483_103104 [Salegentibacter echinorum]|uniref:Uncharacterized protein n=1 Tax=Salegentibacter echinorum TaxID=1073325 RepID=A0A1M5FAX0_SALEC|nr:hypothetical protein SAMN05444483_103104 [Salegentibacter echinorum]